MSAEMETLAGRVQSLREQIASAESEKVVGQFTIRKWAGGFMAEAFQGGPGSSVCLFGRDEAACLAQVDRIYARGMVPMNAIPSSQYFADARRYDLSVALRARPTTTGESGL